MSRGTWVRLAAGPAAVVALGSAILSWDALSWGAGELGVDRHLTWLYPVVVDGNIAVGTVAALALRRAPRRVRAYVWTLLAGAISASVVGNGAHAASGSLIHVVGAAVPAIALAASLHLLVILVRHVPAAPLPGEDQPQAGHVPAATTKAERAGRPDNAQQRDDDPADVANADGERPDERNPHARVPARGEVQRLLARQRGAPSDEEMRRLAERVKERTGVSIPHARRLLREESGPRVVSGGDGTARKAATEGRP